MAQGFDKSEKTEGAPAIIARRRPRPAVAAFRRAKSELAEMAGMAELTEMAVRARNADPAASAPGAGNARAGAVTIPEWGRIVLRAGTAILR